MKMGNDLLSEVEIARGNMMSSASSILALTGNLASSANAFVALYEKIEKRAKEVTEKEKQMRELELKLNSRVKELEIREAYCSEREQQMEDRVKAERIVDKSIEDTGSQAVVTLNVGGPRFMVAKETLLKHKGSYFDFILSSEHFQLYPDKELIIERDPKLFRIVLKFLRAGKLPKNIDIPTLTSLKSEFEFYGISFPESEPLDELMRGPLEAWFPQKKIQLLYKATRDGFGGTDFHRVCDNKGGTITVIQSKKGYLFGGYTPLSWDSSGAFKTHPDCFIFTITNPHAIPPTRYPLIAGDQHAILCNPSSGPIFGRGHEIYVCSNSHQKPATRKASSFTFFPASYVDTTGKGNTTFTGSLYFTANEIEVYLVQ